MVVRSKVKISVLRVIAMLVLCSVIAGCSSDGKSGAAGDYNSPWVPSKDEHDSKCARVAKFENTTNTELFDGERPLDLPMLIDVAFENSPVTKKSWQMAKIAAAQSGRASSIFFPTVRVSGNVTKLEESSERGKYITDMIYPAIDVQYSVFQFGGHKNTANAARELLYAANYQHNRALQTLAYNVQKCYFAFDSSQSEIDASEKNMADAVVAYEAAFLKHQSGLSNIQDYLQAKANKSRAEFELESARAKLEVARANLAKVIGVTISDKLKIVPTVDSVNIKDFDIKIQELMKCAMALRQDVMAQCSVVESSERSLSAKKSKFFPELVLSANGKTFKKCGEWRNNYSLTASLQWTIFDGLSNIYEAAEARAKKKQAEYELKQLMLDVASDVWAKYHAFKSAVKQLGAAKSYEMASKEAFDSALTAYNNGLATFNDLLAAQNGLGAARKQTVASKNNLSLSIVELAYSIGINLDSKKIRSDLGEHE